PSAAEFKKLISCRWLLEAVILSGVRPSRLGAKVKCSRRIPIRLHSVSALQGIFSMQPDKGCEA
ncbi:MAG TPA: hypothetical protein VEE87_00265, partial [archaeon]|nr:hypothetical protein [archaeon]